MYSYFLFSLFYIPRISYLCLLNIFPSTISFHFPFPLLQFLSSSSLFCIIILASYSPPHFQSFAMVVHLYCAQINLPFPFNYLLNVYHGYTKTGRLILPSRKVHLKRQKNPQRVTEEYNQSYDREQHKMHWFRKYVRALEDGGRKGVLILG